jgi:hypothetical protein
MELEEFIKTIPGSDHARCRRRSGRMEQEGQRRRHYQPSFGQKTHLTAFSCGLLMIITQEPAQSLAALDALLSIEVTVPRK